MASGSREENIYFARLAEQGERYEDMIRYMKAVSHSNVQLSNEERNLLSVAFKQAIGQRRVAWRTVSAIQEKEDYKGTNKHLELIKWYRAKIEKELTDICEDVIKLLDETLIPNSTQQDAKVFYMKMKGDYYRYLCEFLASEKYVKPSLTLTYFQLEEIYSGRPRCLQERIPAERGPQEHAPHPSGFGPQLLGVLL